MQDVGQLAQDPTALKGGCERDNVLQGHVIWVNVSICVSILKDESKISLVVSPQVNLWITENTFLFLWRWSRTRSFLIYSMLWNAKQKPQIYIKKKTRSKGELLKLNETRPIVDCLRQGWPGEYSRPRPYSMSHLCPPPLETNINLTKKIEITEVRRAQF